jgi:DNA-binding CsgD family transcriptional regulator
VKHPDADLAGTAAVVQCLCDLPAVPTIDWCDRAADCLRALVTPSCAVVLVAARAGHAVVTEAVGVGGSGVPDDGTIVGIRARCERAVPASLVANSAGSAAALAAACGPREGWCDPVSVFSDLGPPGAGRMLTAALTAGPGAAARREALADMLAAVAPALVGRARLALGGDDPPAWLTEREQQVLSRLVQGLSVREIAEALQRSPHTVHDHVKTLHKKLHASTRGALVARALGHPEPPDPLIPQTRRTPPLSPAARAAPAPAGPRAAGRG